ncbi:c-type cytochrome [Fulvivirgaceae bacterium PWU5]|uniref:C-type cytochrome n=1 Tax=Dawidia cretensis TaxID=2782350 RepID=A0AAP2E026_9BACT|nr:c-type cytochrome [Dawidia cretensis]MBT1709217.1 c-type cytochrome [Dawidia cretensis]
MIKKFTASACKFTLVLVFALLTFSTNAQSISTEPAAISAGESLFNANCKACHRVHQKLVGPALAGVYDRTPSIDWIKAFVKNSSKVIASGDDYANKLYNEYNKTQMTAFSSFKDEDVMNILAYVKAETDKGDTPVPTPGVEPAGGTPASGASLPATYLNVILIGMIVILILLLVVLGFLVSALKRFLDDKQLSEEDKEEVSSTITVGSITRSRGFIFVVVFLVAGLGFKAVINNLFAVGVQIGYAPKQPIAFSHKIHAGQLEIDCKYCHVGVTKGKSATIPSVNICMNCHNQVKSGATTGEGEIAKIVKAWETKKPIEWIRIHNLPDLAYFNHSQHVSVGGVECQTCHGPIETMDVVRQHSLLTMGWCIDCHRKTDVNSKGNAYYDNLVELHSQSNKTPMKVEDIGGLECSKCHY